LIETIATISFAQVLVAFGVDLLAEASYTWVSQRWKTAGISNHDLQIALCESYQDALSSIEFGLRQREGLLDFIGKRRLHKEVTFNFNQAFLIPFAVENKLTDDEVRNLARESSGYCRTLRKAINKVLPKEEISGISIENLLLTGHNLKDAENLRRLNKDAKDDLMQRVRSVIGIPELFFSLLEYKDLLIWSIVFYYGEKIKANERVRSILTHNELIRIRQEQSQQHQEQVKTLETAVQAQMASFERSLGPIRENFAEVLDSLKRLETEMIQVTKYLEGLVNLVGQDRCLNQKERHQLQASLNATFDLASKYDFDDKKTLGFGAVATVYKGVHKGLKQPRAIKILKQEYRNDVETVERFLREAVILGSLSHPNIVQIHDAGGGGLDLDFYIEMELIDGITLRNFIKTQKFDWARTLNLTKQLASAIEHMHERGIIHRDLNPHNIMIDKNGDIKIMDFGVAKIVGLEGLTRDGAVIGTADYMAPEQARGERVDERGDIYTFGLIVYEICTRRLPSLPPKPLRQYEIGVPEWFEPIMRKCLAPKREQRFATIEDVLKEVEEVEKQEQPHKMCSTHPKKEAVSSCTDCSKTLCKGCAIVIEGRSYCRNCAEKIFHPAPTVLPKQPSKTDDSIQVKKATVSIGKPVGAIKTVTKPTWFWLGIALLSPWLWFIGLAFSEPSEVVRKHLELLPITPEIDLGWLIILIVIPGTAVYCLRRGMSKDPMAKQTEGKVSDLWWILPLILPFLGGIIAWAAQKSVNWRKAINMLMLGIVSTVVWTFTFFQFIYPPP
jgi:serine/threonine protein kinase